MSCAKNQQKKIVTQRARRQSRTRAKIWGTGDRPRLTVFRSNKHIRVQVINDDQQHTLASACDSQLEKKSFAGKTKKEASFEVGKLIADKASSINIKLVVFDRGAYKYHGRIKALAEGARKGGLVF
ncbi:50S ribosomal protein L18 [Patescibacteria group bacterium]|nr:50S ribosomal protein L18 [Patescibacteria group bacterium]